MNRRSANWLTALVVSVGACFFLTGASALFAAQSRQGSGTPPKPAVSFASRRGVSAPMRDYKFVGPIVPGPNRAIHNELGLPKRTSPSGTQDSVLQAHPGVSQPALLGQFEGQSDDDNAAVVGFRVVPPDTNGDVGPNHYVQFINLIWAVYDKTGALMQGPLPGNSPYVGFGGPCEAGNDGDPVVKYDRMADRWVLTQFAVPNYPDGPSYQCFAVSQTGDPMGAYWLYEFTIGSLPQGWGDYPKLGVWPDGYYIAFNMFTASAFTGMGSFAFDRTSMLTGDPATAIAFITSTDGGGLPSDLDGPTPPPAGSPNYYLTWWNPSPGTLNEYQFHVDWTTPANSTFTGPIAFPAADFIYPVCGSFACVPQLGSGDLLDTLDDRMMNRLAYHNFGDHESLVTNHTVGTAGGNSGVRWYEIRDPGGVPTVYQQGTYAPDSSYRWMGSIAMDSNGNMALGYSKSDSAIHPSIGITGRLAGDPLDTMGAEDVFFAGAGSQTDSFNRWGDYSSMSIDPTDDCTFWYTQEYYASTGSFDFKTRIGSFKFPGCLAPGTGIIQGTVDDGTNPIAGVHVGVTGGGGGGANTDASGNYSFALPVGTYSITASKYGYLPSTVSPVDVTDGGTTTQDFTLSLAPMTVVSGTVTDGSGQGWPLYAKLVITGSGTPTFTLYTDPLTGAYSKPLVNGISYGFSVSAAGYNTATATVPLGPIRSGATFTQDFSLTIDATGCSAPGYSYPGALFSGFGDGVLPPGWSVVNNSGNGRGWNIQTNAAPCSEFGGNLTGGTGPFAVINSDCDGFVDDDAELRTPSVDMSGLSSAAVRFNLDYYGYYNSTADVDISTDGGATWTNVFNRGPGTTERGPALENVDITGIGAGQSDVRARFHYTGYFAWWWQVDNVLLGEPTATCQPGTGGLVVGNVHAGNTSVGFNGATITNTTSGGAATSFATPNDPNHDDGFYVLFAPAGAQTLQASLSSLAADVKTPTVVAGSIIQQDFSLRFLDVPDGSFAENFIYGLAGSNITAGCGGGNYCPNGSVTRAQMAVFIEKAAHGPSYVPPACVPSGVFGDVLCPGGFAVDFIEALYYDGIAAGCAVGPPPLFCPNDNVTRAQMAVFIEKGANGPAFVPPPCTGIFSDVPCPGGFAVDFIEALYNDGIAAGCGGGLYCPNDPVTRAQMAVFIDVAFNVPHL